MMTVRGFLAPVQGQCDGVPKLVMGPNAGDVIKSPNFDGIGGEYSKSANCSWKFDQRSNGKEYALKLTVEQLILYVVKDGARHCPGSYILAMNNAQTQCDRFVHGPTDGGKTPENYFCNAYYSSPTCANVTEIQKCETRKRTSFPVPMTYFSDGRTSREVNGNGMGFRIRYRFFECLKEPPTTMAETTTVATTTTMITDELEQSGSAAATSLATKDEPTSKETEPPTSSSMPIAIIGAAAGGGGLILIIIIIVVAVCLCKRRGKATSEESQDLPLNDAIPAGRNGNGQSEAADTYDTVAEAVGTNQSEAADTYDTVAGAVGTNQSEAADTYDTLGGVAGANQSGAGDTYDTLGGTAAPSQPQPELYATVSNLVDTPQSLQPTVDYEAPAYSTVGGEAETSQAEPELYSVVSRPPNDPQPPEEDALYSAVSIRNRGEKSTIHYKKSMVDNVLYGTTEDM